MGTRTPRLFLQVCDLLQGTAHSPSSVPHPAPLWYSLGSWLLRGVFPGTWQLQWEWQEFSRAASGIVQSRWELKEQRATLKHFLGLYSSLQFCLRTDSAASAKSATPKITDERGIQELSLYYWKALRHLQCSASWEKKIPVGVWFSSFTTLQSENVPGGFMVPFGGRRCECLLGNGSSCPIVCERITVLFPVALSAQGLPKMLTSTPLGKPGRPKFSPWFFL